MAPVAATAHNAGASENLTVNGRTPTDGGHTAVLSNGKGNHPNAEFENDTVLEERNPNAK